MKIKSTILAAALLGLSACETTPAAVLEASALPTPVDSVDGSAIAFQADALSCNNSTFRISPKLSDGKYGDATTLTFIDSYIDNLFKGATKNLEKKRFRDGDNLLYVKTMAPGTYVVTRPTCNAGNYYYYTNKERIDIYGEFTVDAGKTNYLGTLQVGKGIGNAPVFRAVDHSATAKPMFDERFADRVAPWQVNLAKTSNPTGQNLDRLMKLIEELRAIEEAKKAKEETEFIEQAPVENDK